MTEIKIVKNDGYIVSYTISGHTGYGEEGYDILCSAISFISQTVILSLNEVCKIKSEDINFKIEDGYLGVCLNFDLPKEKMECSEIVMNTMLTGFKSLLEGYPDHITLNIEEVDL
ncbi:MAG: ribosomal-processing cysteine protease Prp [Andreesenia angusta]|nr:ribosomal-processing cysteine protease Prp [Andreesenia angusta]